MLVAIYGICLPVYSFNKTAPSVLSIVDVKL